MMNLKLNGEGRKKMKNKMRNRLPKEIHFVSAECVCSFTRAYTSALDSFDVNLLRLLFACYIACGFQYFSFQFLCKILTGNKDNRLMQNAKKKKTISRKFIQFRLNRMKLLKIKYNSNSCHLVPIQIETDMIRFTDHPIYEREWLENAIIIKFDNLKIKGFHQSLSVINLKFFLLDIFLANEDSISMQKLFQISEFDILLQKARTDYQKRKITYNIYKKRQTEINHQFKELLGQLLENAIRNKLITSYEIKHKKLLIQK